MKHPSRLAFLLVSFLGIAIWGTGYVNANTEIEVIVLFNQGLDGPISYGKIIEDIGGTVWKEYDLVHALAATISLDKIDDLRLNPYVSAVEVNNRVQPLVQSIDWGVGDIGAPTSWNNGFTGDGIDIGIIDSGIQTTHPDLNGAIVQSRNLVTGTTDGSDLLGHGTHIAGIIAAQNNAIGYKGIAFDANLYNAKIRNDLNGQMTTDAVLSALDWLMDPNEDGNTSDHVDIINMSFGSYTYNSTFEQYVNNATNLGILLVAASGNDGLGGPLDAEDKVMYPARYANVVAVGMTDGSHLLASASNRGNSLDVVAPGVNIYSTFPTNGYQAQTGTSMASPYVAGLLALYKEQYPTYTVAQLRGLLYSNALDLGAPGKDYLYGYGLVQSLGGFRISYTLNGGIQSQNAPVIYDGNTAVSLGTPTRSNYAFLGWYSDPAFGGTPISSLGIGSSGDLNLYAKWGRNYTGTYFIRSKNSGLVMDVYNGGRDNGNRIIQWPKHGGTNQQWVLTPYGSPNADGYYEYYTISSVLNPQYAVDVYGGGTGIGNNMIQYTKLPWQTNQQWRLVDNYDGTYGMMSKLSEYSGNRYLLDVDGGGKTAGVNVIQWTGLPWQDNQKWYLDPLN